MGTEYGQDFYDTIRAGSRRSAAVIAGELGPTLLDSGDGTRVLDVGCGEGWFGASFAHGIDADGWPYPGPDFPGQFVGIDGPGVPEVCPVRHSGVFVEADLRQGWAAAAATAAEGHRFDLAVCLEVGEHLPERSAHGLVRQLTEAAPVVLFSAACPGQVGPGHVNLQWPSWWARHFASLGYWCTDGPRWDLWDRADVEPWYRQNLLLFVDLTAREDLREAFYWCGTPERPRPPASVIHPDLWMPEGAPGL
jgi:SAM-dependent methyltransferase